MYFVGMGFTLFVFCVMAVFALDIVLMFAKLMLALVTAGLVFAVIAFLAWFFWDILRVK